MKIARVLMIKIIITRIFFLYTQNDYEFLSARSSYRKSNSDDNSILVNTSTVSTTYTVTHNITLFHW